MFHPQNPWLDDPGIPQAVTFIPHGYRDVFWCSFLNEPAILEHRAGAPACLNCGQFDPATHPFICHIEKVKR